jgi:anthranilate/para-aminobenzoate synthase component II
VRFHPESIMTLADDLGLSPLANVMDRLASAP